jgi:four helix bundle protein
MVQSHRELIVWQKSMDLVVQVYRLTAFFPSSEQYRLIAQTTRAAASVPANIAEGNARGSRRDYAHFLSIGKGSLMETETFVLLAVRLGYITEEAAVPTLELIVEISKMLTAVRQRLLTEGGH